LTVPANQIRKYFFVDSQNSAQNKSTNMKPTMIINYLATIVILIVLSFASAKENQREVSVANFPKNWNPKNSKRKNFGLNGMSSHGHHGKVHKREGNHYHHSKKFRQSKKFHNMHPEITGFDKSEELLKLYQIKSALQEEKISKSIDNVSFWRSSSSSSSLDESASSSFDDSAQEAVKKVADKKKVTLHAEQEGIARMEKEGPSDASN